MKHSLFLLFLVLTLAACENVSNWGSTGWQIYKPVYAKASDLTNIGVEQAKSIAKPGKVYVIGDLMLQNDVNTGVHFINISDPKNPVKLSFLRVPFSTEISVKGIHLYVNNFNDLLVFNISDPSNPSLVKRMANVFPYHNSEYPPVSNTYFECVDPKKGIVIDWVAVNVNEEPKCRR